MNDDPTLLFAQQLRARRKAVRLSQTELAERVGLSFSAVQKIEAGQRRPSRQVAEGLAGALGVPQRERARFVRLAMGGALDGDEDATATPNNLPAQLTGLVGREGAVEVLAATLRGDGVRLVTAIGSPGVGKTRLALAAASDLLAHFPDGVYMVPLATLGEPKGVLRAVARSLGMRKSGFEPLSITLRDWLREKRILLVLDNMEHLLEAAPTIASLLEGCPSLKALATSREALHIRGERLFEVSPLSWPDNNAPRSADDIGRYPAVALFVDRAREVDPHFRLDVENAEAVAALCGAVEGLPLAIELLAARVKLMPPHALLGRLQASEGQSSLSLLTDGPRDLPERQRTLRRAIGWSYDLLNEGERTLFARLGVFVGGCTLSSVEAVCNARGDLPTLTWEGLSSLLDKCLVKREAVPASWDGEPRYTMLEMVREYAVERLEEGDGINGGEAEKVKGWFLDYYLALTVASEPHLLGADQKLWLDFLEGEHDNLRAALAWAFERDQVDLGLQIVCALRHFWYIRGHFEEGLRWTEAALLKVEGCPVPRTLLITALNAAGWLAMGRSRFDRATRWLNRSLSLAREEGDPKSIADTLHHMAVMLVYTGKHIEARQLYEEALSLRRELGDRSGMARTLGNLAGVAMHLGELEEAYRLFRETLFLFSELEHKWNHALMLSNLAHVTLRQGDYSQATAFCQESLKLDEASGKGIIFANTTNCQGDIARYQGDYENALRLYRASLEASNNIDFHFVLGLNLLGLGCLSAQVGSPERAATYFGALEGLVEKGNGAILMPVDKPEHDRYLVAVRTVLDEATFNRALAEGRAMTVDMIVAYAQT